MSDALSIGLNPKIDSIQSDLFLNK
jgi:hypothetical protein